MSGNARRSRGRGQTSETSWDRVARWYDGWVGDQGSRYHQALVVPAALDLLDPRTGEAMLEIGAGQGVLAPHVARLGAQLHGGRLEPEADRDRPTASWPVWSFLVGDARRLPRWRACEPASFDAAVFLLSIQDMDPLELDLPSASLGACRHGRIVIVMTHPAFRQPRHAGWGFDDGRKLVFRRVDAYLAPMAVPMKALGDRPPTVPSIGRSRPT